MPKHKLVQFPTLRNFCAAFHAASHACIERTYAGLDKAACDPFYDAFKECKKRYNAIRMRYEQELVKLEDVPRKDSEQPPSLENL
ncbi:hypothetical protein DFJ74DRAFT_708853 [Hyaloraphidium curvatum]|nr:hypothetical protein DFJ74DRAFT_708853 [Hyaloraphidium curvatum]